MNLSMRWRIIIALAAIVLAVFSLWPTIKFHRMSAEKLAELDETEREDLEAEALHLGLDLLGGMHLVLELEDEDLEGVDVDDLMDRALQVIRNRIDEFGVAEPIVQQAGSNRIIVELPGVDDFERAQRIINRAAVLEFRMVRSGDEMRRLVDRLDMALAREAGVADTAAAEGAEGAEVAEGEVAEGETPTFALDIPAAEDTASEVAEAGEGELAVDSATLTALLERDITGAGGRPLASRISYFQQRGTVAVNEMATVPEAEVRLVERYLAHLDSTGAVPEDVEFVWDAEFATDGAGNSVKYLYLLTAEPELTGEMLEDARPQPDRASNIAGNFLVQFDLSRTGRRLFSRTTGENVGRLMAIVLDGKTQSAPEIQEKIRGGSATITGRFTPEDANDLAIVLRAGALPAKPVIEEQRAVGPSLGHDSIDLGKKAILYGFIGVLVFMIVYYRVAGVVAVFALLLNLVLLLAILVEMNAVLTLPGIAALVLTVGMAVDANVLIFERIREELRLGQTTRNAVNRGYSRAFRTILDANVTTLITALVLLRFGTGPIKGFAVTLSVGIVVSMFTALFVSRIIFDLMTTGGRVRKLSI